MSKFETSAPSTIRHVTSQVFNSAISKLRSRSPTDPHSCRMKSDSPSIFLPPPRAASTPPERPKAKRSDRATSKVDSLMANDPDLNEPNLVLSKKKSQYYDKAFASREPFHTANSRSARESLIIVEVKLNCCVRSEHDFLTDLTLLCSEIYQRPTGCVMTLLNSDYAMLLGNSAESAYQVSITAWATEVAATKNKRTAGLVQEFMRETTRIPASRGIFQFNSLPEENMIMSRSDSQEQLSNVTGPSIMSDTAIEDVDQYRNLRSRKSSVVRPAICSYGIGASSRTMTSTPTSPRNVHDVEGHCGSYPTEKRKVRKRKSLMALLGF